MTPEGNYWWWDSPTSCTQAEPAAGETIGWWKGEFTAGNHVVSKVEVRSKSETTEGTESVEVFIGGKLCATTPSTGIASKTWLELTCDDTDGGYPVGNTIEFKKTGGMTLCGIKAYGTPEVDLLAPL